MTFRYVPILRWKRGERIGVQRLSAAGRHDVSPCFVLGRDRYVGRAATKNRAAIAPANVVASEILAIWNTAPFYLDAAGVPANPAGRHPLIDIGAKARAKGLRLIPVARLDSPLPYWTAVRSLVRSDQRGLALKVDLNEFASAANWIALWPYQPSETDLIVDFADNVENVAALGSAINPVFRTLQAGRQWRSVTMCGTSMPENFAGYVAGQYLIPRTELALWQRLSRLRRLPYRLDFGDYATVPVIPPPIGIRWGFPINVRYTLPQEFLICRGVQTTGPGAVDMDVQLLGHAQAITAQAGRSPLVNCWGDTTIDSVAAQAAGPQGLEHWVRIGVNRRGTWFGN